jgi:hypothetical protein
VAAAEALITPALFSQPPPLPDGRRGRKTKTMILFKPPLSRRMGGRLGERGLGE